MKPIKTNGTNSIYGAEGYVQLPAQLYVEKDLMGNGETHCIQTVWELSEEDIAMINGTKRIYVSTVGETIQPIALDVIPFVE